MNVNSIQTGKRDQVYNCFISGATLKETIKATSLSWDAISMLFTQFEKTRKTEIKQRLGQIYTIENALFEAIELYKKNPSEVLNSKIESLSKTYCKFLLDKKELNT